jgi:hypothetical protein
MAQAQGENSRGVSQAANPNFDLNHSRPTSMSEMRAIGAPQSRAASEVRSSSACSGGVPSNP